jgi:hypothetical protein
VVGAVFSSLSLNLAVINYMDYLLFWKILTRYCDIACYFFKNYCYTEDKGKKDVLKD